jgi:multiple sugar transport system permease protein
VSGRLRETLSGYGLLAPAVTMVFLLALVPVISTVWLSLHNELPIFAISEFIGLENFSFLLRDPRFWNAVGNTAYFVVGAVSIELVLGLGIALLLNRKSIMRGPLWALVMIPWAVPNVVAARFWEWIFNADFGVLNYLFGAKINWLGDPFWAIHSAILADVWKTTPFVVLLLLAGLQAMPEDVYRAARVDGAGTWRIFWHITLPLLRPIMLVVLLFRTLDSARIFDLIFVLTGGGPANRTETLAIYAYKLLYRTLQFGYGSAVAVATFVAIFLVTLPYLWLLRKSWRFQER